MSVFFDYDRSVVIHEYHKKNKYYITSTNYRQLKGTGLPANSTETSPPETPAPSGMTYVFTGSEWNLAKDDFTRPEIKEETYIYRGENRNDEIEIIRHPQIYFPQYNDIDDYISSQLKTINLSFNFTRIQKKYFNLIFIFNQIIKEKDPFKIPEIAFDYRMESESFVAMIRSFFDEIVQLTHLLINKNTVNLVDSIGALKRNLNENKQCYDIFFGNGDIYISDSSDYLTVINDLSNSIKHSSLHYECYSTLPTLPNVFSIYKKQNNFKTNEVIYHNHAISDLLLGFKDNFHRIIKNQQTYIKGNTST